MKSKPRASVGSSLNLSRRANHFWRVLPTILLLAVSAYATEIEVRPSGKEDPVRFAVSRNGETVDAGNLRRSEAFRAIVARMSGAPGLEMERLAITIDRYTTDHDARLLLAAQKSGGESAWLDAIHMMHKGVVSLTGGRQWMIHAVRATAKDTGRSLVIIAGPLSAAGARGSSRSPDDRFGVIELQIDEAGRGGGRIIEAARIWLDESGTLQVDSSTGTSRLLVEVEPAK